MRQLSLVLSCILGFSALGPQTLHAQASPSPLPEAYAAEEFPEWALSLRRWEIVSLGAFPIALFYTHMVFDVSRYIGSGFDSAYAPWPLKNEFSYKPSPSEWGLMFLTAGAVAAAVGLTDAIILRIKRRE